MFNAIQTEIAFKTGVPQTAMTCSKLTIETLEHGTKYAQS